MSTQNNKKRKSSEAGFEPLAKATSSKVSRTETKKDCLASKCQQLYQRLHAQLTVGSIGTDNGAYTEENIKHYKNINHLLKESKMFNTFKDIVASSINQSLSSTGSEHHSFDELLANDIVSFLFDLRVIQFFECLLENKDPEDPETPTFVVADDGEFTYNDLMNPQVLYYLSRHEIHSNFVFEEDAKKLLNDIHEKQANMRYFVNQLIFHEPVFYDDDYCECMEQEFLSEPIEIQKIIQSYYNEGEWQLYSIFMPWLGDKRAMKEALENLQSYDEGKDRYDMYPYSGNKYVIMHSVKEDEMVVFWGDMGMDFDWLERP